MSAIPFVLLVDGDSGAIFTGTTYVLKRDGREFKLERSSIHPNASELLTRHYASRAKHLACNRVPTQPKSLAGANRRWEV